MQFYVPRHWGEGWAVAGRLGSRQPGKDTDYQELKYFYKGLEYSSVEMQPGVHTVWSSPCVV